MWGEGEVEGKRRGNLCQCCSMHLGPTAQLCREWITSGHAISKMHTCWQAWHADKRRSCTVDMHTLVEGAYGVYLPQAHLLWPRLLLLSCCGGAWGAAHPHRPHPHTSGGTARPACNTQAQHVSSVIGIQKVICCSKRTVDEACHAYLRRVEDTCSTGCCCFWLVVSRCDVKA
jgi:hypothetical protein